MLCWSDYCVLYQSAFDEIVRFSGTGNCIRWPVTNCSVVTTVKWSTDLIMMYSAEFLLATQFFECFFFFVIGTTVNHSPMSCPTLLPIHKTKFPTDLFSPRPSVAHLDEIYASSWWGSAKLTPSGSPNHISPPIDFASLEKSLSSILLLSPGSRCFSSLRPCLLSYYVPDQTHDCLGYCGA